MQKNYALRRSRKGKGLLPPNPKRWEEEHNGLDLRHELNCPLEKPLSHEAAFSLVPNTCVVPHTFLPLDNKIRDHFSAERSGKWSGMCIPCENVTLVIYNDCHAITRTRATLLEEFFHLWLNHDHTRLRIFSNGEGKRDFDQHKEAEAYGSGAAALVPYKPLRAMLKEGESTKNIAHHFMVSEELVQFRVKVCRLKRINRPRLKNN